MFHLNLDNLGLYIRQRRGNKTIREAAQEMNISPATLSRIENGKTPDILTFKNVCIWLAVDAGKILGCSVENPEKITLSIHLKKDQCLKPEHVYALTNMIIKAQKMFND